ncbi:hypothetical protein P5E37_03990 [Vibrio parahaemolyticus]|nr:hypothetical protein [Vibrio parahaemolyticus]
MTIDTSFIALILGVIVFLAEVFGYMRKFSPEGILVSWASTMFLFLIIYLLNVNALAEMVITEKNRQFTEGAAIPLIVGTLDQIRITVISYSILTCLFIAYRQHEIEKESEQKHW